MAARSKGALKGIIWFIRDGNLTWMRRTIAGQNEEITGRIPGPDSM
jgi:hypothetical protein